MERSLMKFWILSYAGAAVVMLVIDAFWLTFMGRALYRPVLGDILLDGFRIAPAIVFYLLYVLAIQVFAVAPAVRSGSVLTALAYGAFLGLVCYGTYDLTNHATLKAWTTTLTIIDMAWGTVLTSVTAGAGYMIARTFAAPPVS
jgi:uncharacterized membrane protein